MNKHSFNIIAATLVVAMFTIMARANSTYSNEVMSLNPAAYWPLQLTNTTNIHLATNSGTLGAQGDAHYDNAFYTVNSTNFNVVSLFPGPGPGVTSDGDAGAKFNGGTNNDDNSQYLIIPDVNNDLDQGGPAFTAEAWVYPEGGDPNDPTGTSFASTEWTSIMAKGGGGWGWTVAGDANGNTYGWSMELAGIYCLGAPVGWYGGVPYLGSGPVQILTNACWVVDFYNGANANVPSLEFDVPMYETTPQWFHLVLTYDGVNAFFYTNGVLAATTVPNLPQSTNDVFAPASEQASGFQNNWPTSLNGDYEFPGTGYAPDTINPMVMGNINTSASISDGGYPQASATGYNCQNFNGIMDELAFYTNSLAAATVLQHYQDATSSNHKAYTNDVLSANPPVYLRFDEPDYTGDPAKGFIGFPVVTNYGTMAAAIGYQVNILPVTSGPQLPGMGSDTNAILCNGMDAAVDVGDGGNLFKTALDPTGFQPLSVAFWAKGNPADIHARFQSILGRGNSGWRFDLDSSGDIHFNPGNGPELTSPTAYNDGNWHHIVGVSDGSSDYLYIDGQLSTTGAGVGSNSPVALDLLIGGVPDYSAGSGNRFFDGQIAHLAFFTNVLSPAQVLTLYNDAEYVQPIITENPQNLAVNLDASGTLSVLASGEANLSYQWYLGSTKLSDVSGNISGSATANLTISDAQNANAGQYTVVVSNSSGSVTSSPVSLTVYSSIVILTQTTPATPTLYAGGKTTFSVLAAGELPISYQWYSNSVPVANATNTTYALTNAQASASVYCLIGNSFGTVPSSTATLSVITPASSYPATIVAANPAAFWRLNEADNGNGNDGVLANDYWGGNEGVYTNTLLGQPGYNASEPTETSAVFGALAVANCLVYNIPTNVDFSAPAGSNSQFSVECWENGFSQIYDSGLVSKGISGGEQFDLDTGADGNTPSHDFRFLIREASGAVYAVNSTFQPDGQWHYLVGVCNEAAGYMALYIDGVQVGQTALTPGNGIFASPQSIKIGSRPVGSNPAANTLQFAGNMDDVAVYNYALSSAQVQAHYDSAEIPAKIAVQPTNVVAGVGGTATLSAQIEGTPTVTNQWFNENTGEPIPGATNTTLVLTDVQGSDNGNSYYLTTSNAYGGSASISVSLTVISGTPQIYGDVQSPFFAIQGGTASNSVVAYGTEPLGYQWQLNGTNLTDGAGITGSKTNVIIIANALANEAGGYRVIVTNSFGSVTSSVAQFIVGTSPVGFNGNGGGWQANGNSKIGTNLLTLTDGNGSEASSFFYNYPQYIGAFKATYTYQDVGGAAGAGADGVSFCIQNDTRGTAALGGNGGSLGVGTATPITPSAELEFNLYAGNTENVGYTFLTDGLTASAGANGNYAKPGSVIIDSGDPINVSVYYDGNTLSLTLSDAIASTTFSTNLTVGDLTQVIGGDTAYVGFTGGDGGVTSTQTITNFSFVSIPLASIQPTDKTVVISWPSVVLGYGVQETPSLTNPKWVDVTNQVTVVGGLNEVTLPIGSTNGFYRLELQ